MSEQPESKRPRDYHLERHVNEMAEKLQMEKERQDNLNRLRSNPEIKEYLEYYHPNFIESFITSYSSTLPMIRKFGQFYMDVAERQNTKYMERAMICLAEIQLKKLFDARLQWGANQIELDGIRISADFIPHVFEIMNSKVIPPITEEEFDLYMEYAKSGNFTYDRYHINWLSQVVSWTANRPFQSPEWFLFHNLHTGSQKHLQLPDHRGIAEIKYRDLAFDEKMAVIETKIENGELPKPVEEKRPAISAYSYYDMTDFMQEFETPETLRLYEAWCKYGSGSLPSEEEDEDEDGEEVVDSEWLNERIEEIMGTLSSMKKLVLPIEASKDWRLGLLKAWEKYEKQQLIKMLPAAFEDYCFRVSSKIDYHVAAHDFRRVAEDCLKEILDGRVLAGEERNLDF